jgi:hypothetical protein
MTKTSPDNNLNYINFLKHFCGYHTKKLKYRDLTCLILERFCHDEFATTFFVELESVIIATSNRPLL